jgi:Ca-activated chloride channel family protein
MLLASIQLQWPLALLLLPVVAAAAWYGRRHMYTETIVVPSALPSALPSGSRVLLRQFVDVLAWVPPVLLVVALARPQQWHTLVRHRGEGIDIILALDVSSSMLARDFQPDRLTACKQVATAFVDKRPSDRVGLVLFAAEAYTQSPLTTDHRLLKEQLAKVFCGELKDGTAIGQGLATAVGRLSESRSPSKVVVLLTDGQNNAGVIEPLVAAQLAQNAGVRVYTIGVGKEGRAQAPVDRRFDGQYIFGFVEVAIDEVLLREIAAVTGGKYFRATDNESLVRIYDEVDRMERYVFESETSQTVRELGHYWIGAAAIVWLLVLLLRNTWLKNAAV